MKLKKAFNNNIEELISGVFVVLTALGLIMDNHYFFFPPELQSIFNSNVTDIILIIAGIGIIYSALTNDRNEALSSACLIIAGTIMAYLISIQLIHIFMAGQIHMVHTLIGFVLIIVLLIAAAYKN